MTETQKTQPEEQNTAPIEATVENADTGAQNRITELEAQVAQLKDQSLRYLAEAENTRRRAQKEREDTAKYAVSGFAKDILAVADNFQRALEAMPKDEAALPQAVKNLITGIEATDRQLQATLERAGIKKLDPLGQPFDPNFHRVMMETEDAGKPAGTVVQVLQAGYVIHDRLLREALVAVSKGGVQPSHQVDTTA